MRRETLDVRPCAVAAAIAFFTSVTCLATPVSLEQAKTAAANWFRETSSEETTQSETVLSAFTLSACDGKAAAHVINFAGGGYVIMSAESELSPVLAFSPTGTIEGQGEGALWELVEGSIGRFVDAKRILGALAQVTPSSLRLKGAAAAQQTDDGSASEAEQIIRSAFSKAEAEWAEILPSSRPAPVSGLNLLGAAVPTTEVQSLISQGNGIIYVEPILGNIRWNQSEVGNITDYCYNYYTTNHWPCGCVATAMAQVMRHYQFPKSAVPVQSFTCKAKECFLPEGAEIPITLSIRGGTYKWSQMPENPNPSSLTLSQRQAIGHLTHDCSVALEMNYTASRGTTGEVVRASNTAVYKAADVFMNVFGYASAKSHYSEKPITNTELFDMVLPSLAAGSPAILGIHRLDSSGEVHGSHAVVADGFGMFKKSIALHINAGWGNTVLDAWYFPPEIDFRDLNGKLIYSPTYSQIVQVTYNIFPQENQVATVLSGRLTDKDGAPITSASMIMEYIGLTPIAPATISSTGVYRFFLDPSKNTSGTIVTTVGDYPLRHSVSVPCGSNVIEERYGTSAIGNKWLDIKIPDIPVRPSNDNFENAYVWTGTGGVDLFETIGASQQGGEPSHGISTPLGYTPSVWYRWTSPFTRWMKVNLAVGFSDEVIAVYTGESVDNLTLVATSRSNEIECSVATAIFKAEEGVTYHIAVATWPLWSDLTGYIQWGEEYPLSEAVGMNVKTNEDELQWFGQTEVSVDEAAGQSGLLEKGQQSWISFYKHNPGILKLKARLVGKNGDTLTIHGDLDGVHETITDTGGAWVDKTLYFRTAGYDTEEIFCVYSKGTARSSGEGAWIDCMQWIDAINMRWHLYTDYGEAPKDDFYLFPGECVGELPSVECEGMVFDGWRYADTGKAVKATDIVGEKGFTARARWVLPIEFDPNGGSFAGKMPVYHYEEEIGEIPEPVREGFSFLGWYTSRTGGTRLELDASFDEPQKFYAHWGDAVSSVFHGPILSLKTSGENMGWYVYEDSDYGALLRNGPLGNDDFSWLEIEVEGPGVLDFEWSEYSYSNYNQARYFLDGEDKGHILGGDGTLQSEELEIPAGRHRIKWRIDRHDTYNGTYHTALYLRNVRWLKTAATILHYGDSSVEDGNVTFYEGFTYGALPLMSSPGKTFLGWWTQDSGGRHILPDDIVEGGVGELWARWSDEIPNSEATRESGLEFETGEEAPWFVQGGETSGGDLALQSGAVHDNGVTYLATTVVGPGNMAFSWKVSSEENFDFLRFFENGDEKASVSGTNATWTAKTFHVASGTHNFKWSYSKDNATSAGFDCGWVDQITWTPCVKISFDTNGGGENPAPVYADIGGPLGVLPEAGRDGYIFLGWYKDKNDDSPVTPATLAGDDDATLVAQWGVEVLFDADGGNVESASAIYRLGKSYAELPVPVKTGCSFTGWFKDANKRFPVRATDEATGDVRTMYAGWTFNTYTVAFDLGDGSQPATAIYQYGGTYGQFPSPSREGRLFVAWADEDGEIVDASDPVRPCDATFHAIWAMSLAANFSAAAIETTEGAVATVKVSGGNFEEPCSVNVFFIFNTATSADVDLAKGTIDGEIPRGGLKSPVKLEWAAGEVGEKTIAFPVKSDTVVEGDEFLTLQLGGAKGMEIGAIQSICTVRIADATQPTTKLPSPAQTVASSDLKLAVAKGKWSVIANGQDDSALGMPYHLGTEILSVQDEAQFSLTGAKGSGVLHVRVRFTGDEEAAFAVNDEAFKPNQDDYYLYYVEDVSDEISPGWNDLEIEISSNISHKLQLTFYPPPEGAGKFEIGDIYWEPDAKRTYTIALAVEGGGTVSGAGAFVQGAKAPLVATPSPGYEFAGWEDATSGEILATAAKYSLVVARNMSLAAHFSRIPYVRAVASPVDAGKVSGSGLLAAGKKLTLKATATKGCVFAGWRRDDDQESALILTPTLVLDRSAKPSANTKTSTTVTNLSADTTYYATFITAEEDRAAISFALGERTIEADEKLSITNYCGVATSMSIESAGLSATTVKASGLPSGLKLVQDKTTLDVTLAGIPTAPSKIDPKTQRYTPYQARFTVASAGGNSKTYNVDMVILPLPDWAQGTWTGDVTSDDGERGLATLSVGANGKISGKISFEGVNWTFKSNAYSHSFLDPLGISTNFTIITSAKAGKTSRELVISVMELATESKLINAIACGTLGNADVGMWRGLWKDKTTQSDAKATLSRLEGMYSVSIGKGDEYGSGYLSLTVGKEGNAKAAGKLADGTSVTSGSTIVLNDEGEFVALIYASPSAYKSGFFCSSFTIPENREASGTMCGQAVWINRNPEATEEYGAGFSRAPTYTLAYYDKLQNLKRYYEESLVFTLERSPTLNYIQKRTSAGGGGKKTTESITLASVAADTLAGGLEIVIDAKGKLVIPPPSRPVQDKTTKEWLYEGANDGALSLSFNKATGIFKGSWTFWYDYISALDETSGRETWTHTSKKINFEGIAVQGAGSMDGFYLWDSTGSYLDPKTNKPKSYKCRLSFPVELY